MNGVSSERLALKVDVIGPENIPFAGASVHHSAPEILQAAAVKGLTVRAKSQDSVHKP